MVAVLLELDGMGGGKYVLIIMHGRSLMAIDALTPTTTGRSKSGFQLPGRHCLHQARSASRCWASRIEGELRPAKERF